MIIIKHIIVVDEEEKKSKIAIIGDKNIQIKESNIEYFQKGELKEPLEYDGIIEFESESTITLVIPRFASEKQKGTIYFTLNDKEFLLNLLVKIIEGTQLYFAHIYDFGLLRKRTSKFVMKTFLNQEIAIEELEKWIQTQKEKIEINKGVLLILQGYKEYKTYWTLLKKITGYFKQQREFLFDIITAEQESKQFFVGLWIEV